MKPTKARNTKARPDLRAQFPGIDSSGRSVPKLRSDRTVQREVINPKLSHPTTDRPQKQLAKFIAAENKLNIWLRLPADRSRPAVWPKEKPHNPGASYVLL